MHSSATAEMDSYGEHDHDTAAVLKLLEDPDSYAAASPSHSVGVAHGGSLEGAVQLPSHPGYSVREQARAWGTSSTIDWMVQAFDSLVRIDPAAPRVIWVHWIIYNLSPSTTGLMQSVRPQELPWGALQGVNDWKKTGYGGPCPPVGRHRYFFKLYALDAALGDLKSPNKAALEKAMQGHALEKAELVGTYEKVK